MLKKKEESKDRKITKSMNLLNEKFFWSEQKSNRLMSEFLKKKFNFFNTREILKKTNYKITSNKNDLKLYEYIR